MINQTQKGTHPMITQLDYYPCDAHCNSQPKHIEDMITGYIDGEPRLYCSDECRKSVGADKLLKPTPKPITVPCPCCGEPLTAEQIKTLRAKVNGRKGARTSGRVKNIQAYRQAGRRDENGMTALQGEVLDKIALADATLANDIMDFWVIGLPYNWRDQFSKKPKALKGVSLYRPNKQAETWRKYYLIQKERA
jgi:hypothetical protein